MTAPEPLTLTLEEAMRELAYEHMRIVRYVWDLGEPGDPYVVYGPPPKQIALQRPVVARDDAAELRAALEQLLVAVEGESNRLGLMGMVDGYYAPCLGEADAAVVRARAALAATEEEL